MGNLSMLAFATFVLLGSAVTTTTTLAVRHEPSSATAFNWSSLEALPKLQYQPCYHGLMCSKLLMPLDWHNDSNPATVSIAIIKRPAIVPQSDPTYGGTIITNPGGPGGSGVADLIVHGGYLQNLVDDEYHYDMLSFDPRGIGHSRPEAICFRSQLARDMFAFQQRETGDLTSLDPHGLQRRRALAQAFGHICSENTASRQLLSHMSTAVVARDMLEIVDSVIEAQHETPDILVQQRGLRYLGFSYGTQLGNTFASIFPDRVEAMVLDGMVDSNDYSNGLWNKNLFDTEAVIDDFYSACYHAGSKCELKTHNDIDGHSIRVRVESFIHSISRRPAIWIRREFAEIITAPDIRSMFIIPAYIPVNLFQHLPSRLAAVIQGNFTALLPDISRDTPLTPDLCPSTGGGRPKEDYFWGYEAALTYICNDGADRSNVSGADLQEYISYLNRLSPTMGSYWAQFGVICSEWRIRPAWRYDGPYTRDVALGHDSGHPPPIQHPMSSRNREITRPKPLLFLASRRDPVTPLRNSFAMSSLHPGSAVVIQESAGHCAVYSSPSACTKRIVAAYFANGTMPQNGTTCSADCQPSFDTADSCRLFERGDGAGATGDVKDMHSRLPLMPG